MRARARTGRSRSAGAWPTAASRRMATELDVRAVANQDPPAAGRLRSHEDELDAPKPWLVWAALGAIYLIWGSTYLAIRVMVETVPPLLGAGFRFLVAGAIFYLFLLLRRGAAAVRFSRVELLAATGAGT